ncbi:MAG: ABC transporter ATP-binding protein [Desulfovibrionaceae bacterium]|nr:ABC transporter ATP-binding protein [Desulfovibrionaceae bacterium]
MSKPSVIVEGLSKKFGLSLKSALKYGFADSFRRLTGRGKNANLRPGEFWALKDVNFALEPGDALGIMGVNGSGKTTMLRILNGSYTPDAGKAVLRGRVGALIAAGAGFSPLLTGRENVFISAALLGMSPQETRKRFDEIVHFADIGDFIDMPVRNYSSGMNVRLGFAIAVLGTPEILLVDEVLAVGDLAFQKKCYERLHQLRTQGVTILLVSHSIGAIWSMCNKSLYLSHGEQVFLGSAEEGCRLYDEFNARILLDSNTTRQELPSEYGHAKGGTGEALCTKIEILSAVGDAVQSFTMGDTVTFCLHYQINTQLEIPVFRFSLDSPHYKMFFSMDSVEQGMDLDDISPGNYVLTFTIDNFLLRPGSYTLNNSITTKKRGVHVFYNINAFSFQVTHPRDIFLYASDRAVMFSKAAVEIQNVNV